MPCNIKYVIVIWQIFVAMKGVIKSRWIVYFCSISISKDIEQNITGYIEFIYTC